MTPVVVGVLNMKVSGDFEMEVEGGDAEGDSKLIPVQDQGTHSQYMYNY